MNRPEQALHIKAVAYLRASLPKPWIVWHTPNQGEQRTQKSHGIRKAMGVLAGMPDLFVIGPPRMVGGVTEFGPNVIAIEFKAPPVRLRSGGLSKSKPRLSPAQRARQADLGACGVPYLVIDDMADMVQSLKALGVPLRGRVM